MKIFKKALAAASSAAMAASLCTASIGSLGTAVAADVSAIDIVNDMGLGWNLGNTFDSWGTSSYADKSQGYVDNETAWGNVHTTQDIIDAVKAQGFNSVRIPVSWGDNVDASTFDINDKYLARIKEVIDYCYNNDMYAIINMHWDWESGGSGFLNKGSAALPQFKAMWSEIATYFSGYDNHLVFESMNEVTFDYATLNSFNQSFVDSVRAAGGNNSDRLLVCSGANADLTKTCDPQYKVPTDDMVAVDIHYYTPATFCVAKKTDTWGYTTKWGTDSEKNEMVNNFEKLKSTFVDKGIPVIVGEYGVLTNEGKDKNSIHEFNKTVATLGKSYNGIATYLWDDSDSGGHMYFSRSKLAWHDAEMGAIYKEIAGTTGNPTIGWVKTGVSPTKDEDGNVIAGSYIIESGSAQKIKFDVDTEYTRMSGTGGVSYWDLAANGGKGGWVSNGAVFQFVVDENGTFELNQVNDLDEGTITNRGFIQLPDGINVETVQVQFYFAGYATEAGDWTNLKADQYPTISTAYIPGISSDPDPVVTTTAKQPVVTTTAPVTTKSTVTTAVPVGNVKGNAYLAGGIGGGQCWGLDEVNKFSKTAAITGDGQYEVEWVVDPEVGGTDTVQFLAVIIEPDGTVENFTTDSLPNLEITLDEVWIDGKQLTDYTASENAVDTRYYEGTTNPGTSRIYLHDDWSTKIKDLAGDTEILESVKVVFTVKGVDAGYVDPSEGDDILWGDANDDGSVDIADATLILQHVGNGDKYVLSEKGAKNADVVNNGGGITSMDSLAVQMYDANIITADQFPIRTDDLNSL